MIPMLPVVAVAFVAGVAVERVTARIALRLKEKAKEKRAQMRERNKAARG